MRLPVTALVPLFALSVSSAVLPAAPAAKFVQSPATSAAPVLLTAEQVAALLPPTVYYRGKTAPVQVRNSAAARFGAEGYVIAAMVDTSGYASSVQETYQLYLITETALSISGKRLTPGAYGAGVVNGKFVVTDLGGHVLLHTEMMADEAVKRPRPLQMMSGPGNDVKLYLGRSWISLSAAN